MGVITEAMLKRRAEHNEGILHTLEELVLQEEGLTEINPILGSLCPNLRIVYMPNNLIPRIESMHRLKDLRYLNLAVNNIEKIEGLKNCEFLEKLDLTLNFVSKKELTSVTSLQANAHLEMLFLTGNPCQDFHGYRKFVIATLPTLKSLDGISIKPSERIAAEQESSLLMEELTSVQVNVEPISEETCWNEKGQVVREYSTATRVAEHTELEALKLKTSTKPKDKKPPRRRKGFDPLPAEGRIYQKNEGSWDFKLTEPKNGESLCLDVPVGRFLDTSLIDVDVHPTLIRVLVKGKLLQLHLPEEVSVDNCTAQRSKTTGNLLIRMSKVKVNQGCVYYKGSDGKGPKSKPQKVVTNKGMSNSLISDSLDIVNQDPDALKVNQVNQVKRPYFDQPDLEYSEMDVPPLE